LFPRFFNWDNWTGTEVACAAGGIREQEIFGNGAAIFILATHKQIIEL